MTGKYCMIRTGLGCERVLVEKENVELKRGDKVIVETPPRGLEIGQVIHLEGSECHCSGEDPKSKPKRIVRVATPEDLETARRNQEKADESYNAARRRIAEHKLPMKLIKGEYQFDRSRLTFYFTAENRVDFRALVRDLAQEFKTRIELRQIGVRDEAKILDGYAVCGQRLCCRRWLPEFKPVSIKMAKEQSLPLSPQKISGICGRLLCCLSYEVDQYKEMKREMPRVGTEIEYNNKKARISRLIPLKSAVEITYQDGSTEMLEVLAPGSEKEAEEEQKENGE